MFLITILLNRLEPLFNKLKRFDWLNNGPYIFLVLLFISFVFYIGSKITIEITH